MHRGGFHREGTVAELTRTLPAVIRFSLPGPEVAPPPHVTPDGAGAFVLETFTLQRDLHALLDWARDHAVELGDLHAGPTRLDDVFRAIGDA